MPTDHTAGPIELYMTADHERLEQPLQVALNRRGDACVDAEFRHDLAQHSVAKYSDGPLQKVR